MKIIMYSPQYPSIGGIAEWTKVFVKELPKDVDVSIINTSKKRGIINEIKRTFRIIIDTKKAIKSTNFNIAHFNCSCGKFGIIRDYLCLKIINKAKIPAIFHFHCNIEDKIGNKKRSQHFLKKIILKASSFFVLNKCSYDYIYNKYKIKPVLIPNFISYDCIAKNKYHCNEKIKNVVMVSRVHWSKGINEYMKAAKKLKNINFTVIGPFDNKIYHDTENLFFLGSKPRSEILKSLRNYDVFILPSYSEGFSLSILEAMAQGLPIIVTNVGANYDMLENKGGIIINPRSSQEIIDAIYKISSKDVRKKMSAWNLQKAKEYASEKVTKMIIKEYKNNIY